MSSKKRSYEKRLSKKDDPQKKKTWRAPFRKSRSFDKSCRNGGDCSYCREGRHHSQKRQAPRIEDWEE